jgi:hypothetical protein
MALHFSSDVSYLSEPEAARSNTGGKFYLGQKKDGQEQLINGPIILCPSSIMKHGMLSAAEAKVGSSFNNTKEVCSTITSNA